MPSSLLLVLGCVFTPGMSPFITVLRDPPPIPSLLAFEYYSLTFQAWWPLALILLPYVSGTMVAVSTVRRVALRSDFRCLRGVVMNASLKDRRSSEWRLLRIAWRTE
jgi:hypothetical protein